MTGRTGDGARQPASVVTFGETMALFRSTTVGPLAHADSVGIGIGGAESNVAIALRRLGATVAWAGRVGTDSLGDRVVRELRAENVEIHVSRDQQAPTGLMVKERRTAHSGQIWYYRRGSAGSRLCPDDIPTAEIEQARILHVTGITPAISETAAEATRYAIECAKSAGTRISLDLNYRSALWTQEAAGAVFRGLISDADVVFASDYEAGIAVGTNGDPFALARNIANLGPSQVIIKLGDRGCAAWVDGTTYSQDAVRVAAVDTVGAGDAFVAGYLAELLTEEDVPQRLATAVRTGAFACMVPGDWEGMPRRSELELLDATEPVSR